MEGLRKHGKAILQNGLVEWSLLCSNICFKAYIYKKAIFRDKNTPAPFILSRNVSQFICLFIKRVMKIRLGPEAKHNGPITAATHTVICLMVTDTGR